jgi:hypothetical protein
MNGEKNVGLDVVEQRHEAEVHGPRSHFFFLVVLFAFFGTTTCTGMSAQNANKLAICRHVNAQRSFERVEESLPTDLIILLRASCRDVPS